ncbi:MAG: CPBP family intramembrane metalloprotease [Ruminococcaceae bacterium]|nr:CPBP family intramembrane metalloprotease [Oscillospiraceae bacterium]
MTENRTLAKKSSIIFTVLVMVVTYAFVAWLYFSNAYQDPAIYTLSLSAMMFFPTLCSIVTRLATGENFTDMYLRPRFKGHVRFYLIAWLLPAVLTVAGAAFYFLIFPKRFDGSMGYYLSQIAADAPEQVEAVKQIPVAAFILYQIGMSLFIGLVNIIPACGEELGWRGFFFPRLLEATKSPVCAMLISGVIWGVWHAPIIALGHNYGTEYAGYPWLGIITMTVSCVAFGVILCYVSYKAKSVWPAAIGHGILNAGASVGMLLTTAENTPVLGPLTLALVAGVPTIIVAAVILVKSKKIFCDEAEGGEESNVVIAAE